jgi:hypothetical protein
MTITYSGSCSPAEQHESYLERITQNAENLGRVTLRVPWADRYKVVTDTLGPQAPWPYSPNGTVANAAEIRGVGAAVADGQGLSYEFADVTLTYDFQSSGRRETASDGVTLFSETTEPWTIINTVDPSSFRWGSATGGLLPKDFPIGRVSRGTNLVRTHYNVPSVPESLFSLQDTCNDAPYTSPILGATFDTECLAFGGLTTQRTVKTDPDGGEVVLLLNVTVKFAINPNGWNKWWNKDKSGGAGYDKIYNVNGSQYNSFTPTDYSDFLF